MTAESESVAKGIVHFALFRPVYAEVPFGQFGVLSHEVDGGVHYSVLKLKDGGDALDGSSCSHEVSGHGFGGVVEDVFSVFSEQVLYGTAFCIVAQRC